jgi:hypothetical protein
VYLNCEIRKSFAGKAGGKLEEILEARKNREKVTFIESSKSLWKFIPRLSFTQEQKSGPG